MTKFIQLKLLRVKYSGKSVVEIARWSEIYNALIKSRKGDSLSVGVLEVVD
jgi:hypothetical protein